MRTRRLLALGCGCFGAWHLACTGTISEQPSEPPPRPVTAAAGASGTTVDDTSGGTVTSSTVEPIAGPGGSTGELGAGGAPSVTPEPPDLPMLPPIEFCDAPTKVLVASCGNGSCHSNVNATIGDFAVDSQRAYNFVDRVSTRHADCGKIIDSEDYSKSLLLTKITGDFESPRCGARMPVGSFVITDEQVDCLASWLQQFQL